MQTTVHSFGMLEEEVYICLLPQNRDTPSPYGGFIETDARVLIIMSISYQLTR